MRRYRVIVSDVASVDVAAIVTYVATIDTIDVAIALDDRLDRALRSLERMALRGRIVPELRQRGITSYRELIVPPYRVVYRVVRSEVWVLAVVDGRRDLDELLHDRAMRDPSSEP